MNPPKTKGIVTFYSQDNRIPSATNGKKQMEAMMFPVMARKRLTSENMAVVMMPMIFTNTPLLITFFSI